MSVADVNTESSSVPETPADSPSPQTNLGWEGHVHFQEEVPLWSRLLETCPQFRTGISYGLIFTSGVLLGAALMALASGRKDPSNAST